VISETQHPLSGIRKELPIYEQIGVGGYGDGLIRPGGLALTLRALNLACLSPGSRVLDIGSGTGATLRRLVDHGGFEAVGVEPSAILVKESRERNPGLPLVRASGEILPFANAVMDGVLAECSLSVTQDVDRVLGECRRVLKPAGRLLVSDVYARNPDGASRLKDLRVECCLTGAMCREEWTSRLEAGGFDVTLWEDHSAALREFAARLILAGFSFDAFHHCRGNAVKEREVFTPCSAETQGALHKARPGYFLLIAQKA
jgi:arsenite methyltransferase